MGVDSDNWSNADQLIRNIKNVYMKLEEEMPQYQVSHNVIKRILKLIRDEYVSASKRVETDYQQESLQRILKSEGSASDWGKNVSDFKERVFEIIEELTNDIDSCSEEISKQAIEHIHANEIILTIGRSRTVERFLKNAAKTRNFEVIVAEAAPSYSGHQMATINKVIMGTSSILADGTVVATSGAKTVALAAKHYSVPCIVLGAFYKLTPVYLPESDTLVSTILVSPAAVTRGPPDTKLRSLNPLHDSIPPSLVTLYISNISGYSPSYVYRQMGDLYHHQDRNL